MRLKLLFFGVLTDVAGCSSLDLETDVSDLSSLHSFLFSEYPGLHKHHYKIAVNGEFIIDNKSLNEGDEVAFLPPFAGG